MKICRILTEAPEGTVPFRLPQDMLNNPSSINLRGMAAQAKATADKEAAEKAQAAKFAENKAKYQALIDNVKDIENPEKALEELFEELVPSQGNADTVAGELVRAMMRILYRDYNDGDLFYEGYGVETCGGSVAYLIDKIDDTYDHFEGIAARQYEDERYSQALREICSIVVNHVLSDDSVWQENTEDSRGTEWDNVYESDYRETWEPEYDYDFQIPYGVQEYIDNDSISTREFIEQVENMLDGNGFNYDNVTDGWNGYVNIEGLNREAYDALERWHLWEDRFWSDYIEELVDEYGDLDEDEDDEDFDESLDSGNFKVGDRGYYNGKPTTIRGIEHSDKFGYDYLIDNPDYSEERYPGEDSWKFKKVWVGPHVTRKRTMTESIEEQVIVGFSEDGTRSYYNEQENAWMDSVEHATIYPDVDTARGVWFKLDKKPFKRVFVVCNTPGI